MPVDQEKFSTFNLPDVTKIDPSVITKYSTAKNVPSWRTLVKGLNLEGTCKNEKENCAANGKKVWVGLGYGTFHMSMAVCQAKCPVCKKPTKGDKKIGIVQCELTGLGMKVRKNADVEDTDDEDENTATTSTADAQFLDRFDLTIEPTEEVQEEFRKIICDSKDGFLKMDGVNGPFVQWRYMTLEIKVPEKK